jgi:hypothetical protein
MPLKHEMLVLVLLWMKRTFGEMDWRRRRRKTIYRKGASKFRLFTNKGMGQVMMS